MMLYYLMAKRMQLKQLFIVYLPFITKYFLENFQYGTCMLRLYCLCKLLLNYTSCLDSQKENNRDSVSRMRLLLLVTMTATLKGTSQITNHTTNQRSHTNNQKYNVWVTIESNDRKQPLTLVKSTQSSFKMENLLMCVLILTILVMIFVIWYYLTRIIINGLYHKTEKTTKSMSEEDEEDMGDQIFV